jgi:predicted PurR-regulated permease PerM
MTEGPSASPRRKLFLAVSGLAVLALLIAARQVLLPFVLALVVACVLMPGVRQVTRLRAPRWVAILLVYAVTLGAVSGFVSLIVPRLVAEGQGLAAEWPKLKRTFREQWLPALDGKLSSWAGQRPEPAAVPPEPAIMPLEAAPIEDKPPPFRLARQPDGSFEVRIADGVQLREKRDGIWQIEQVEQRRGISTAAMLSEGVDKATAYVQENSVELLKIGREVVFAISRGIFTLFMTLMLAAYLMLTEEKIFGFFRGLVAEGSRGSFDRFVRRLDRGLSGVLRGQLLICLVNGVLSAIGFWIFGLKYWPILSVVAGVMSLIPIFGSILSSIPAVAIGLTQSPATALGVLLWILGIHQVEANFLNPKIIGDSAKIHPVLVVFALITGEHFFQLVGALFAVPCLSIVQTLFLHFREETMGVAYPTGSMPPPGGAAARPSRFSLSRPRFKKAAPTASEAPAQPEQGALGPLDEPPPSSSSKA